MVLFQVTEGEIVEASDSLLALFGASREDMVGRVALDFVADEAGARARWALMATGQLDGYHVIARECRRLDGTEFTVDTCVTSFGAATTTRSAVGMLLPQSGSRSITAGSAEETGAVMLGTVDGQWRIDRIGAAVEQVLGHLPGDVLGEPISAFVEPTDLPGLLVGVGRGLQTPGGATIRLRLRTVSGTHRHCRMLVTRLAGSNTEGLGFAFAITDRVLTRVMERAWELERVMQHIAREIEATGALAGLWGTPATTNLPPLGGLSARETEIVTRLLMGDRVPMIAQRLFLSQSTVRNHLTSVYRKLGVRSQQQLLSLLRSGQPYERSGDFV